MTTGEQFGPCRPLVSGVHLEELTDKSALAVTEYVQEQRNRNIEVEIETQTRKYHKSKMQHTRLWKHIQCGTRNTKKQ